MAFGLAVPTVVTIAASPSAVAAPPERTVKFNDGVVVPTLGQGSARLGQGRHPEAIEEEALREGISLGMTLIDTAEIYGNGEAERLIGHVIAGQREHVFLVSKVWPTHVAGDGIQRACELSLARLGTDYIAPLLTALAKWDHRPFGRGSGLRGFAVERQDTLLGRLQFQCERHGEAYKRSAWRGLRN